MIGKILPKDSFRRRLAKKVAQRTGVLPKIPAYSDWVSEQKDKIGLFEQKDFKEKPLISIVIPAFNTPKKYLYPLVHSVAGQTYENWELVIVDASSDKKSKKLIEDCKNIDARIKILEKDNEGISANTNFGIKKARGKYIALMDHDDTLSLDALYEVAKSISNSKDAGLIYSDEDKLSEDGLKYLHPHIKPDWSPDLLTHVNYITHLTVIKKELIDKVGGLDSKKDGAQDYDLILKVADLNPEIVHIPKILYHWREAQNSTAQDVSNKPYIKNAGELALTDHYKRKGLKARVKAIENKPGFYRTEFVTKEKTTLIIPIFANKSLVEKYIQILQKKQLLANVKIIIPRPLSNAINTKAEYAESEGSEFTKNALAKATERVIFVNDFVIPGNAMWATDITGGLEQEHIHAVAPIITRADGCVEDAGIVVNKFQKMMIFKGYPFGANTFFGNTDWSRNVDELSGAVIAGRKNELIDFFNKRKLKNMDPKKTLNSFSQYKGERFNAIVSTVPMKHVRSSQQYGMSRFMNPNIEQEGSDLQFYPNDKQMLDVLEQLGREAGVK